MSLPSHQRSSKGETATDNKETVGHTDISTRDPHALLGGPLDDKLAALKSSLLDNQGNSTQDLSSTSVEQSNDELEQPAAATTPCLVEGEREREKEGEGETRAKDENEATLENASSKVCQEEEEEVEEKEVEEEVKFRSLVPLRCHLQLGNASVMEPLSKKAADNLKEAVKMIHASLGKCTSLSLSLSLSLIMSSPTHPHTEKLVHVCSVVYPEISSPNNKELCGVVLEATFFPALMEHLKTVYR